MSFPQFSLPQFSANYADLSQFLGISKSATQTLDNDAILARVQTNWRARLPPSADSGAFSGSSGWEDVRSFVARDDELLEIEDSEEKVLRSRSLNVRPDVFVQETQDPVQGSLDHLGQGTCVDSSQACEQLFRMRTPILSLDQRPEPLALDPDDIPDPPSEAEMPVSEEEEDVEVFEAGPGPPLGEDGMFEYGYEPYQKPMFLPASRSVISGSQLVFRSNSQPAFPVGSQSPSRSEPHFQPNFRIDASLDRVSSLRPSQSVLQPLSQSVLQPLSQSVLQPLSQSVLQPLSQSVLRSAPQPEFRPPSQPAPPPALQSGFQPPSQSVLRPASQAVFQPSQSAFQAVSSSALVLSSLPLPQTRVAFPGPAPLLAPMQSDDYVPTPSSPTAASIARTVSSPLSRHTDHSLTSIPSPSPSDYTSTWAEIVAERERRKSKKKVESPKPVRKVRSASFSAGDPTTPHHDSRQKTKHILKDVASILCNTDGPERRRRTRKRSSAPRLEHSKTSSFQDPVEEEDTPYLEGALHFSERNDVHTQVQDVPELKSLDVPELDLKAVRHEAELRPSSPLPPLEPLSQPDQRAFSTNVKDKSYIPNINNSQQDFRLKSSPPHEPPPLERDYLDEADDVPSPPRSEFCSRPQDLQPKEDYKNSNFLSPPRPLKSSPPFARGRMLVAPFVRDTPSPAVKEVALPSPSTSQSRPFPYSPEPPPSPSLFDSPPAVRSTSRPEPSQLSNNGISASFAAPSAVPVNAISPQTPSNTNLLPWDNSTSPQVSPASPMYQVTPPHNVISPAPPTPLPITPLHMMSPTQPYLRPSASSLTHNTSSKKGLVQEPEPILLVWEPDEEEDETSDCNIMRCQSQVLDFTAEYIPPSRKSKSSTSKHLSVPMCHMPAMRPRDEMSQVLDFPIVKLPNSKRRKSADAKRL